MSHYIDQILHEYGFPVPTPIAHSRHAILMSRIDGYPLRQIVDLPAEHVSSLFASLMALIVRLARAGLIHCDFNEFNIMVREVRNGEDEDREEGDGIWGVGNGLARGGQTEDEENQEEDYQLKSGERIEKGNGFERIYRTEVKDEDSQEEEDSDEDDDDEDESDFMEEEDFDEDGTNEGLKIELSDGSAIEPIVIDFPQMVSVEHVNAE
jgi:RIO kinase 2